MALDKRFVCEKILQPNSDNVSYRHFIDCGYVRTKVIDEISREPFGIYIISAAPGYGKTATAKILEAECITSRKCIPVYVRLSVDARDRIREYLFREFKKMFVERGGEVLRYYAGDYVDKLKKSEDYFMDVLGMMYCSKMCGNLPRALLMLDELTSPGSMLKWEELERTLTELDHFLQDVQNAYCNPVGGVVLMGQWPHDIMNRIASALMSTMFGGLDRVRSGRVRPYTDGDFIPVGDSPRRFAETVLRAYDLDVNQLVLDTYAELARNLPLRVANAFLRKLINGVQPSPKALGGFSHMIEDELANLLGGRARVRMAEGECDVLLPDGRCIEIKVKSKADRLEIERIINSYGGKKYATLVISSECSGLPQCIGVKMIDEIATLLLDENLLLEKEPILYKKTLEKVARMVARKVAEIAMDLIKGGLQTGGASRHSQTVTIMLKGTLENFQRSLRDYLYRDSLAANYSQDVILWGARRPSRLYKEGTRVFLYIKKDKHTQGGIVLYGILINPEPLKVKYWPEGEWPVLLPIKVIKFAKGVLEYPDNPKRWKLVDRETLKRLGIIPTRGVQRIDNAIAEKIVEIM